MKLRLLRGQVVVREIKEVPGSGILWTPAEKDPYKVKTHRGRVLQKGAPALVNGKHEVPHGFEEGDVVQFHFEALEARKTRPWIDGEDALWLAQQEIDAVLE